MDVSYVPVSSDSCEVAGGGGEQHPVQDVGPLLSTRPPRVQLQRAGGHAVEVVEVELLDQLLRVTSCVQWLFRVRMQAVKYQELVNN